MHGQSNKDCSYDDVLTTRQKFQAYDALLAGTSAVSAALLAATAGSTPKVLVVQEGADGDCAGMYQVSKLVNAQRSEWSMLIKSMNQGFSSHNWIGYSPGRPGSAQYSTNTGMGRVYLVSSISSSTIASTSISGSVHSGSCTVGHHHLRVPKPRVERICGSVRSNFAGCVASR